MLNNDVLRSLRHTLKVSDAQMAEIAALGGCTVAEAEVRAWLSREDEDGYQETFAPRRRPNVRPVQRARP